MNIKWIVFLSCLGLLVIYYFNHEVTMLEPSTKGNTSNLVDVSLIVDSTTGTGQNSLLITKEVQDKTNVKINHPSSADYDLEIDDSSHDEKPVNLEKNMKTLFQSANDADWDSFNQSINILEMVEPALLDLALYQAILNNAPLPIIEDLLNRGAKFTPEVIQVLALNNSLELTKELIPLGLDIHKVNIEGDNAIKASLLLLNSRQMFDFLVANGVDTNLSTTSPDPLYLTLEHFINKKYIAGYYIEKLIALGAQVKNEHWRLLEKIKTEDRPGYVELISHIPTLNLVNYQIK